MIGSHDTFTYLKTNNILAKACALFWRCQEKTIHEQYKAGIRVFDIRVSLEKDKADFYWWRIGHGFVEVEQRFVNLKNICIYFKKEFKNSIIRIILEKDFNERSIERFKEEANVVIEEFSDMIWGIYIKKPWTELYNSGKFKVVNDYCCHLFNWNLERSILDNLKEFDISSWNIKSWAKKHNPPKITKKMKDDKETLYFMDYAGIYPEL